MPKTSRTALLRYGVSTVTVGLALLLTLQVRPLADRTPFSLFFAAVMLSTWYGGRRPGLLAIALTTLVGDYLLIPPVNRLMVERDSILQLGTFILVALLINWLTASRQHVAERARAVAAKSERSLAQLEAVFQAVTDGIMVSDMAGNFVLANESAARLLGYSGPEELKHNVTGFAEVFELFHRDGHPVPLEEWPLSKVLRGESFAEWELQARRKDTGREWFFSFSGEPVRDERGEPVLAVIVTRDITERKRAEERLRESEERFRATFEQAAVGIAHVGLDGRWLQVNQRLCDIVGYPCEELLELTFHEITHPADLKNDLGSLRQVLAGEIQTYSMEKRYTRKDGATVWINLTVSLVREASGEPKYFIAVVEDITERKQGQEMLRKTEEQLRLSQRLDAIGQLAGGVAHDFNNLLVVITGYSELMLRRLPPQDPQRGKIEEIKKAGERAASLTRQLLAFSRKQTLQPKVLDLNSVVTETSKMLRRLIGEDIEFITLLRPDAGRVNADPGQLEQVLMNLVVNARDAMPDGGKLIIETANVELDKAYADMCIGVRPGQYVMLAISDTGCGMDAETQKHIFEPFFTTKEVGKGTGLGLSTVYGIVKQSGGNIWVYSEVGKGTTFKIYLPRVTEAVEAKSAAERAAPPRGAETILLVEDEAMVRTLARTILEESGYRVLEAANGEEGIRTCKEHSGEIHLLLTDVVMPLMSGKQLAERIAGLCPQMRVLYMSGYTDAAIVHHGVLDPGIAFLEKPFTPDALARKVREVLDAER